MSAREKALENCLVVSEILQHLPVRDLLQCTTVNLLWKTEADKVLRKKASVSLTPKKVPLYLKCLNEGKQPHRRISHNKIFKITTADLVGSLLKMGPRIEYISIGMEIKFPDLTLEPEHYAKIFLATSNIQQLCLDMTGDFQDMERYFPKDLKLPFLTSLEIEREFDNLGDRRLQTIIDTFISAAPKMDKIHYIVRTFCINQKIRRERLMKFFNSLLPENSRIRFFIRKEASRFPGYPGHCLMEYFRN